MLEAYEPNWGEIIGHYNLRMLLSDQIRQLLREGSDYFVDLCLGICNAQANYSASEHKLGPRILGSNVNGRARVLRLAIQLSNVSNSEELASHIKAANIDWLKISVGSEVSMMLRPRQCWVANVRTIWAHLLVKHEWDEKLANEELNLYRDGDETSEMAYRKWTAIHKDMRLSMLNLANIASKAARAEGFVPGDCKFVWADAVSNWLYENT